MPSIATARQFVEAPTEGVDLLVRPRAMDEVTTEIVGGIGPAILSIVEADDPITFPGSNTPLSFYEQGAMRSASLAEIDRRCPILKQLDLPEDVMLRVYELFIEPVLFLCAYPDHDAVQVWNYNMKHEDFDMRAYPLLHAFMHDFRNTISPLIQISQLLLEKDPYIEMSDHEEAAEAVTTFLSQDPKNCVDVQKLANTISAIPVRILDLYEFSCPISPDSLLQILLNAAFNAAQAGASEIYVLHTPTQIEIIDDGTGFKTDSAQEASAASRAINPNKGNGLGIISRLAGESGGRLSIRNREDKPGAILCIQFGPEPTPTQTSESPRILPFLRKVLSQLGISFRR